MGGGLTTPKGGKTSESTQINTVPPYAQAAQQNMLSAGQNQLLPWIQPSNYTTSGINADQSAAFDLTRQLTQSAFGSQPTPAYKSIDQPAATFDKDAYYAANPGVKGIADAWDHYLATGYGQGRPAYFNAGGQTVQFDPQAYLAANPDVAQAGVNPLQHYVQYGANEGRALNTVGGGSYGGYVTHPEVAAKNPLPTLTTEKVGDIAAPGLIDYRNSTDWKAAADAAKYNATTYDAKTYDASTYDPSKYDARTYDAQGYDAKGYSAQDYAASQVGGTDIQALLNPYTQSVVDTTTANMRRQLDASQAGEAAKAAASGYQGGSRQAVASALMDRDFQTNVATATAKLMADGYDKATATALANAQAKQSAAGANAAAQNTAAQFLAGAQNTAGQFLANSQNTAGQVNTAAQNAAGQFNANAANTAGQFNAGARNTAGQFNAGAQNTAGQFNAGSANTANQYNATAQNARDQYNASQTGGMLTGYNANALDQYKSAISARNTDNQTAIQQAQVMEALKSGDFSRQMQAIQALTGIGNAQSGTEQGALNIPLQYLQALGGLTPQQYGGQQVSNSPNTAPSPLQSMLGLGMGLMGKMK